VAGNHADAGQVMPAERVARAAIRYHKFLTTTRQVSIRNTGTNTLWVSFDHMAWFDVAAGTSFDDRISASGFWFCTQLGKTSFVVNGLSLNLLDLKTPAPTDEELGE
jgi:hypothetical protein